MLQLFLSAIFLITLPTGFHFQSDQGNQQPSNSPSTTTLRFKSPPEWVTEQPSSKARVAQLRLPKADGDKEDGQLVIYYFGPTSGGSVAANIERWIGQMEQPEGATPKTPKTESLTVNGLKVSTVDVSGTYTAEMSPGSTEHHNDPDYRMRAAVVETPAGFYYLKLVGPQKTVARWNSSIDTFIQSFEFK